MLPNPSFDDRGDELHRFRHVNLAVRCARQFKSISNVYGQSIVVEPYGAETMNRTIKEPRKTSQCRIDRTWSPKEGHRDSTAEMFVNQHGNVHAALESVAKARRRTPVGGNQRAYSPRPRRHHYARSSPKLNRTIDDRQFGFGTERGSKNSRHFPVGEMRSKIQSRSARRAQPRNLPQRFLIEIDRTRRRSIPIVVPKPFKVDEFRADAAKILPHPGNNALDLVGRVLRKRRGEVRSREPVTV